jgi:hypothetical protein
MTAGIDFGALMQQMGQQLEVIPQGPYDVVVKTADATTTNDGSKPMLKVKFNIESGPQAGRPLYNNFTISQESQNALRIFFQQMQILGLDPAFWSQPGVTLEHAAVALVGKRCRVDVAHRSWQGAVQPNITRINPPLGALGAPGPVAPGGLGGPAPMAPPPMAVPPAPLPQAPVTPPVQQQPQFQQPVPPQPQPEYQQQVAQVPPVQQLMQQPQQPQPEQQPQAPAPQQVETPAPTPVAPPAPPAAPAPAPVAPQDAFPAGPPVASVPPGTPGEQQAAAPVVAPAPAAPAPQPQPQAPQPQQFAPVPGAPAQGQAPPAVPF